MYENRLYNVIDSDMFTTDDGAFLYQYEDAPVGAQSVLPIHMRNNPYFAQREFAQALHNAGEEESFFEKYKWYIAGGVAVVAGIGLLYATRK